MSAMLVRLCSEQVSGITSTTLIDDIGELYMPLMGAEEDATTGGPGTGSDAGSGAGSGGSGSADDDDDDDPDEEPEDEPIDGKSAKALREENAKRRRKNKELIGRIAELEKQVNTTANAGKSETERLQTQLDEANQALETARQRMEESSVKTAFLESSKVQWHDARTAMKLLDREDIDIEDDGSVSGMDTAIKKLAEEHPYLVKKSKSDDDEGGKSKDKKVKGSSGEGGSTKKKSNDTVDRDALKKKYPALN